MNCELIRLLGGRKEKLLGELEETFATMPWCWYLLEVGRDISVDEEEHTLRQPTIALLDIVGRDV